MPIFKKIAIIGVGLIGGSIGLAVKKNKLAEVVIGIGRRKISLDAAKKRRAVDKTTLDIKSGVKDADLVILAVPVDKIITLGKIALRFMKPGSILIDIGSVKKDIVSSLGKARTSSVDFIGVHPMAGSEKSGVAEARADLFKNTPCIITSSKTASPGSFKKVEIFWKKLGSKIYKVSADTHDKLIAEISHTPHLVASLLSASVEEKAFKFAASGFSDTTRIALSDTDLWTEILMMNRLDEIKHLKAFKNILEKAILALSQGDRKNLKTILLKGKSNRLKINKCRNI